MPRTTTKLTYAEYARIPPDGNRHEILEGQWHTTPAPKTNHQTVVMNLARLLGNHVASTGLGRVFTAPTDVVLSEHDIVQPDILFISEARASIIEELNIRGAPDLVVEVLSPTTATVDRGPKLALYRRAGVLEYWLIDPDTRIVEVHELGSPSRVRAHDERHVLVSALLPALAIPITEIFAWTR